MFITHARVRETERKRKRETERVTERETESANPVKLNPHRKL